MKSSPSISTTPAHQLKSELARVCLPSAQRDPNRKLAWVNSLCIFILAIGVLGDKRGSYVLKKPPPLAEPIPIVIEPVAPPPTRVEAQQSQEDNTQDKSEAPQVAAVTIETPAINFSVPTVGNLIVPAALAAAPPAAPLKLIRNQPTTINSTGQGGERPDPLYPKIAQDLGQQGAVLLSMTVDENGAITAIEVKESSGSVVLDRSALEFVKRHWLLPAGPAGRIFEAPINYVLHQ